MLLALVLAAPASAQVVVNGGAIQAPGTAAPIVGTGTGAISGVVRDAQTGAPVAGAVVSLSPHERLASRAVQRMSTDDLGRFVFMRLPAFPAYYLHASGFGYFDGGLGRETPGQGAGRPIAVADGQWIRDLEIRMTRVASISGRVIDEANEPVVGVIVRALPIITLAGVEHVANGLMATTDDRGEYRIYGLAPGRHLISVPSVQGAVPASTTPAQLAGRTEEQFADSLRRGLAENVPATVEAGDGRLLVLGHYPPPLVTAGAPQAYPPTFYPSARTIDAAVAVEPLPGMDHGGIDVQLRPEPAVRVAGRVSGPANAIAGLVLRLMPIGSEGLGIGAEAATTLVDPDGSFVFTHVPTGSYSLVADRLILQYHYTPMGSNLDTTLPTPAGFTRNRGGAGTITGASPGVGYDYESLENADAYWGRMPVAVPATGVDGLVLELQPTVAIRGRIVWEGGEPAPPTRARMTPNGIQMSPAETLPVSAEPADGTPTLGMPRGEYVIATKEFSVAGLRAGEYMLSISGLPGVKSVTWNGRDFTNRPFDASEGHDFDDVILTVTGEVASISGAVTDESGRTASTGVVVAFPTDPRFWSRFGLRPARLQEANVGIDGAYSMELPAGEYYLAAIPGIGRDGWRTPAMLERLAAGAARVQVDWGQTVSQAVTMRGGR